jgi:hypothetical protein
LVGGPTARRRGEAGGRCEQRGWSRKSRRKEKKKGPPPLPPPPLRAPIGGRRGVRRQRPLSASSCTPAGPAPFEEEEPEGGKRRKRERERDEEKLPLSLRLHSPEAARLAAAPLDALRHDAPLLRPVRQDQALEVLVLLQCVENSVGFDAIFLVFFFLHRLSSPLSFFFPSRPVAHTQQQTHLWHPRALLQVIQVLLRRRRHRAT